MNSECCTCGTKWVGAGPCPKCHTTCHTTRWIVPTGVLIATDQGGYDIGAQTVKTPTIPICRGCQNEIDPDTCWCGASHKNHGSVMDEGHPFVPMGCTCLMIKEDPTMNDAKVIDWPFPWPRPKNLYETDGPRSRAGRQHDVVVCGVLFMVAATGDTGSSTARDKFRVDCQDCNVILHENTTGPSARVREHLSERHGIKVRW